MSWIPRWHEIEGAFARTKAKQRKKRLVLSPKQHSIKPDLVDSFTKRQVEFVQTALQVQLVIYVYCTWAYVSMQRLCLLRR